MFIFFYTCNIEPANNKTRIKEKKKKKKKKKKGQKNTL
jgi:hypothetical protein